jgi:hypothetical protein
MHLKNNGEKRTNTPDDRPIREAVLFVEDACKSTPKEKNI